MASRQDIKKDINSVLGGVIEECYSEMLNNPGVNEDKINTIIDDAVDLADDLIEKVNASKKLKGAKEIKPHFQKISTQLEDKAISYIEQLNAL